MQRSLSILLPVKDAQDTLHASIHNILDMVSDSIERFEVLIVDDGSKDATPEIAYEFTRQYPQIRVVSHGVSLGREAAVRTGLSRSQGDVVVMHDESGGFRVLKRGRVAPTSPSRPAKPNYLGRVRDLTSRE